MKATTSIDRLAIQVQLNLFEYFYFHNKVHLEGSFSSPRSFQNMTKTISGETELYEMIESNSSISHQTPKNHLVQKIQKTKARVWSVRFQSAE